MQTIIYSLTKSHDDCANYNFLLLLLLLLSVAGFHLMLLLMLLLLLGFRNCIHFRSLLLLVLPEFLIRILILRTSSVIATVEFSSSRVRKLLLVGNTADFVVAAAVL